MRAKNYQSEKRLTNNERKKIITEMLHPMEHTWSEGILRNSFVPFTRI